MLKNLNRGISTPIAIGIIAVLVIVVGGGILAYQYYYVPEKEVKNPVVETPKTETPEKGLELSINDIKNSTYKMPGITKGQEYKIIQFVNGRYEENGYNANIKKVAFGDLNNDNKEDAAVILSNWSGGTGILYWLAIVVNKNGSSSHIATQNLGDRIVVNSTKIQGGIIIVDMLTRTGKPGEVGSALPPEIKTIVKYKLSGNTIISIE